MAQSRRVFAVFEGGGAKGLFHIATLGALQNHQSSGAIQLDGYAGTSAGAIVATLAACGYTSSELADVKKDDTGYHFLSTLVGKDISAGVSQENGARLVSVNIRRPTDLLKWHHWQLLRALRYLQRSAFASRFLFLAVFFSLALPAIALVAAILGMFATHKLTGSNVPYHGLWAFIGAGTYLVVLLLLSAAILIFLRLRGLASLWRLERALDCYIRVKLKARLKQAGVALPADRAVTFRDLSLIDIRLSLVATDVSSGQLVVFSSEDERTHNVSVARATIASAAVPFLFRPVGIEGKLYCDGGLVSNLPSWVFDRDTVNDAEALVVASNLVDLSNAGKSLTGAGYFVAVARAAVFGADYLSQRGVRGLFTIELPAPNGLLDFDFDRGGDRLVLDFLHACTQAEIQFKEVLNDARRHDQFHQAAQVIVGPDAAMRSALARFGGNGRGRHDVFYLWHCLGFDRSADRYLSLCPRRSMIAESLASGRVIEVDLKSPAGAAKFFQIDRDGMIQVRTPEDRRWSMSVPLPQRAVASGNERRPLSVAVTVDTSGPISAVNRDQIEKWILTHWNAL